MLVKFVTSGFKLFDKSVELDLAVSKGKNTIEFGDKNILKSAIIYGANNSGKSSFIDAVKAMKELFREGSIHNFPFFPYQNIFSKDSPISFEVEFIENEYTYVYGIEIISEENLNEYLYINDKIVLSRGKDEGVLDLKYFQEDVYKSTYDFLNSNELFITKVLSFSKKLTNTHVSNILKFFNKLRFFDNNTNDQFADLMIECLEDKNKSNLYNSLLEKADISLLSRTLTDEIGIPDFDEEALIMEFRKNKDIKSEDVEMLLKVIRIKSVYKHGNESKVVPSNIFDSVGTAKFSNLLLLVMDAIQNELILIVDEIDNSLHFRITRELIKLMNSEKNKKSQFIMSAHDIKLLTPLLFRKEQVNLIERSNEDIEMYSLGDFEEIRNDSSFENLYIKNKVGALPHPDLEEVYSKWVESNQGKKKED